MTARELQEAWEQGVPVFHLEGPGRWSGPWKVDALHRPRGAPARADLVDPTTGDLARGDVTAARISRSAA